MARKTKVPKKIAGVKLPKPLRRGLRDLAASGSGRLVLVEALAAAGAALAAAQAQPGPTPRKLGAAKTPKAADGRAAAALALEQAVRAFTDALRLDRPADALPPAAPPPSTVTH
ncbi:hypothetical protein LJR219_001716 [Phenylobacterium sp. LjRoot219]|uniref:hypothetical protein n=1 Tax=Phenylobacterium sp. LjRoot219 TaxID=3342283 RepID=UPI003ECC6E5A